MSDDLLSLDEENEKFIFRASEEWELQDCSVVEGPFVLKHNGKYYLTYSANHYRSPDYAIGVAIADNPYGPFVKYANNPILHKTKDVHGTGHHSFFYTEDGKELVCVYHRHFSTTEVQPRLVCVDRAAFVPAEDGGADILTVYGPSTEEQTAF
jgi:GH43 family beta-xylosidase